MSVPEKCTVLVIGGGPAGSYAANVLARDNIDTVVIEAEKFPRYHVGESMLPSMGHFLRFIELYDEFNAHGFRIKKGAAFQLNKTQPEAYTDFIAAGGPNGHAWNVVRSEADEMLFRHAGKQGAKLFDGTKVDAIQFEDVEGPNSNPNNVGKPVSATWSRKDGSSGTIAFDYVVDASGRSGILSTKYLKHRKFNQNLKNIANWGYFKNAGDYGVGTHREGSPYFEALHDASGWCWFIPLHDGTTSVGLVRNQDLSVAKRRELGSPSLKDFFMTTLDETPIIKELLAGSELVSDIKSASDWSYSAPSYAIPHARIAGDAGCFIDPYFSSGVHIAILAGLSSAITIAAAIRGDCDEETAASWHSKKVAQSYTRFYLVVSSAMKQIRSQNDPVIQDIDEEGFQRAFDIFRPVIQGTVDADTTGKLSQAEIAKTVEFCHKAFSVHVTKEAEEALIAKLKKAGVDTTDESLGGASTAEVEKTLTPEESEVLAVLMSRRLVREDNYNMDSFTMDSIDGLKPKMDRGKIGLTSAEKVTVTRAQMVTGSFLEGQSTIIRQGAEGNTV